MAEQPQVNLEHVINILRIRLSDEIYHRALLEAAYQQQKEQLDQLREQAANQHTKLSQELETAWTPLNQLRKQTDTTTTTQANNPETAATPADTSTKPSDIR